MDMTKPRAFADFGNRLLYSQFDMTVPSVLPTATMFQLVNSALIIWGSFSDEEGVVYALCREMPGYSSNGGWVMSDSKHDGIRLMPESAGLWRGALAITSEGNRAAWQSADIYQGREPALRLSFDHGRVEYEERGLVSITAQTGASGYQFYDATGAQGSTNHVFLATGRIGNKQVTGWLGLNAHFQAPGINYRISPMIKNKLMVTWFDVGNIYEDGSWEQGPIIVGREGFSFVMIVNDKGQVTHSSDVIADFRVREDGYPVEMLIRYFDAQTGAPMEWVWKPKPHTEMVDLPKAAPYLINKRSSEGSCIRVGEKRSIRHASSWPEFQADDRVQAYRSELAGRNLTARFT